MHTNRPDCNSVSATRNREYTAEQRKESATAGQPAVRLSNPGQQHKPAYQPGDISQLTDKPAEFADIFIARRQAAASEHNNTAAGTDRLGCCTHASTECNNSPA